MITIDDEGLPKFTASGGRADIECYDTDCDALVEVTLMRGDANQTSHEMPSIADHLKGYKTAANKPSFSIFIAPIIRERVHTFIRFLEFEAKEKAEHLIIKPYTIEEFIHVIKEKKKLIEFIS